MRKFKIAFAAVVLTLAACQKTERSMPETDELSAKNRRAVLRENPKVWQEVTIYIRKRGFDEPLKTQKEILEEYSRPQKKKKN